MLKSKKDSPYFHWLVSKKFAEAQFGEGFFVALVDLRGGPHIKPNVYIVSSEELTLRKHVGVSKPGSKMFWCWIDDEYAPEFRNRWDRIQAGLA